VAFNLVSCVRLALLYIFHGYLSWFRYCCLSISHEISWKEYLKSDLFCIEWDVAVTVLFFFLNFVNLFLLLLSVVNYYLPTL